MNHRLALFEQDAKIRHELPHVLALIEWDFSLCPTKVARLLRGIHDHLFEEEMNVFWLEAHCRLNGNEVKKRFKQYTKFRVHEYIENRRIQVAMWLLWDNDLDIATISYHVGYSNYRTFARAFGRQVGCPPARFRARWSRDQGDPADGRVCEDDLDEDEIGSDREEVVWERVVEVG